MPLKDCWALERFLYLLKESSETFSILVVMYSIYPPFYGPMTHHQCLKLSH
uniref:Uncharacterized protein n=1 Tax=Arundo donax TaxID=35708 RepID=A0A0A9GPX9_ARUDO